MVLLICDEAVGFGKRRGTCRGNRSVDNNYYVIDGFLLPLIQKQLEDLVVSISNNKIGGSGK
jgi:hypothetical protein